MRSSPRKSLEDERALAERFAARAARTREGEIRAGSGEPSASAWHPLEFDQSGFPVRQQPDALAVRMRRLLAG